MDELIRKIADMTKVGKLKARLKPHQRRVVERISQEDQPGLVVAHGLGTGKTLASIAAVNKLDMPADIIVPASLVDNYLKEQEKHLTSPQKDSFVRSMQGVVKREEELGRPILIVDEAHRIRNPSTKGYRTIAKSKALKRLLLTASPIYNHPADLAPLVNLAAGGDVLPLNRGEFSDRYIKSVRIAPPFIYRMLGIKPGERKRLNPSKRKELSRILNKWVDYQTAAKEDFPEVNNETIRVPMTRHQRDMHDAVMGQAPFWLRAKIRAGIPLNKRESSQGNRFLWASRQISNTTGVLTDLKAESPKLRRAVDELKKELSKSPRSRAVVYSNYIDGGLVPYSKMLEDEGISHSMYTGRETRKEKERAVKSYNSGKLKALLLSSAGGEGLDLKGTRLIQILEPHFNKEKLRQVEGRGIRYKSHSHLPPGERKVLVQHYLATKSTKGVLEKSRLLRPGTSTDEFLSNNANIKDMLSREFIDLLKVHPDSE